MCTPLFVDCSVSSKGANHRSAASSIAIASDRAESASIQFVKIVSCLLLSTLLCGVRSIAAMRAKRLKRRGRRVAEDAEKNHSSAARIKVGPAQSVCDSESNSYRQRRCWQSNDVSSIICSAQNIGLTSFFTRRTTRITGRRELMLISKSAGHRRSRACVGSSGHT